MRIDRDGMSLRRLPGAGEERSPRPAEASGDESFGARHGAGSFGRDRFIPTSEGSFGGRGAAPHGEARRGPGGYAPMPPGPNGPSPVPGERAEHAAERFAQADQDGDGVLSQEEFAAALAAPPKGRPPVGLPPMAPPPAAISDEDAVLRYVSEGAAAPESEAAPTEIADEQLPTDAASLQVQLLQQLEALLADPSLTETDRQFLAQMADAVHGLDPADPAFTQQLEQILKAAESE